MADTLKQVQLDRQRLIENNKGASESSRAALSAISGRNVLKTKTEVEKLRRNEEIARQQNAALAGVAEASNAIAMEKARLADVRHEESLGLSRERLALSRSNFDLQRQRLEDQKKRDQKNDVLSMLNMGIFDPSFAATLEMPEDIVRQAAANKKAQIDAARARKAAAAKAEADYNNALKQKDDTKPAEKTAAQKGVDKAIEDAEKKGTVSGTAAEAKEGILSAANVGKVVIPWATPTDALLTGKTMSVLDMKNATMPGSKQQKNIEQAAEQRKVEIAESEKRTKEASVYYDEAMTRRVYEKEKAGDELSPLENLFKTENENSTAYTLRSKRFAAEDQMAAAVTPEEVNTAYNEYLSALDEKRVEVIGTAIELRDRYLEKQEAAETFTAEELEQIEETKVQLEDVRSLMVKEIEGGILTEEGKKLLQTEIENIDAAIEVLESASYYEEHFEEYRDELVYRKMDAQYGGTGDGVLEAYIEELEKELELSTGLPITNGNFWEWLFDATSSEGIIERRQKRALLESGEKYQEYVTLKAYLATRKEKEKKAESDEAINETLENTPGESPTDKVNFHLESIKNGLRPEEEFYGVPMDFYNWDDERQLSWLKENFGDGHNYDGFEEWTDSDKQKFIQRYVYEKEEVLTNVGREFDKAGKEFEKDLINHYVANVTADYEVLLPEEKLQEYVDAAVEHYGAAEKELFTTSGSDSKMLSSYVLDMWKYKKGRDGVFEGDYSDIVTDIEGFLNGEYGYFTPDEGKRVLALMERYGTDAAFDYYAATKEAALRREAEGFGKGERTIRGVTSGLTQFIANGGEMLENAFTQQYSRIAGTLGTASHQINMEEFSRNTGIVSEAAEMLYMAGYSIIEMAPAVALNVVPYVGPVLSFAYTFAKVMATSYNDSILQGKRADEALTYSILTATAEAGLEKVLGTGGQTFAKTGAGKVWKEAVENLSATKAMKVIIKTAGSMGSEGFEEFLQECLSPFLEKVAADLNGIDGATLKEIDWDEAAKSFAIGSLTGFVFGGIESISSTKNGGMKESEAQALLESGRAVEIIHAAAELGNRRAMNIKQAMQNKQTIYEGQQGLYAYASVADMVNMAQSIKRRTVRSTLSRLEAKYAEQQTDEGKRKEFKRLFKKILQGNTLTLQETANIINDPAMADVLNEMLGMDVVTMLPDRVRAMTKLLAFAPDGKISKERLNLFRDAFGEIDAKAIEDILTYSDMGARKGAGIIYEDPNAETQLTEAEQEAADVLKILSSEVGTVFYVTERFETGTYLAANVMAVKKGDLAGGVLQTVLKRVYYITMQLNPKAGKTIRDLVLGELKNKYTAEAFSAAVEQIRKEMAVNGNDVSVATAENELCAREFPNMMLEGALAENLAAKDLTAVQTIRKSLYAVQSHLSDQATLSAVRGKVTFDGVDQSKLNDRQKVTVQALSVCFGTMGINVEFFESPINAEGQHVGINGSYDPATNTIRLDIAAGIKGEDAALFTAAHELTHFIKVWSEEKYQAFADFLLAKYAEHGVDVDALVQKKIEQSKNSSAYKEPLSPEAALEEVICDSCETFLRDSNLMETLSDMAKKDPSLYERIKTFFKDLLDRLRRSYQKLMPDSAEANIVLEMTGCIEELHAMWEDAALSAREKSLNSGENVAGAYSEIQYQRRDGKKKVAHRKKSYYNEFRTNAMIWAHSTNRKSGDATVLFDPQRSKWVLLEALEDGYFEASVGGNEILEEFYEQTHGATVDKVYEYSSSFENAQGGDSWDLQFSKDGGNGDGNNTPIESGGLQGDIAGSDEHLRGGDQGKSIKESDRGSAYMDFVGFNSSTAKTNDLYHRLTALVRGEEVATAEGVGREADFDIDSYADQEFTYSDAEQVRAENDGRDSARNFEDMTPDERDAEARQMQADIQELIQDLTDHETNELPDTRQMIGAEKHEDDRTLGEKVNAGWNHFRRKIVDAGATVYSIAQKTGAHNLYHYFDSARAYTQAGVFMIDNEQRNLSGERVGDSLAKVWEPIFKRGRGYAKDFDDYLLHLHNVDRMSRKDYDAIGEAQAEYQVAKQFLSDELQKYSDNDLRAIARDPQHEFSDEAADYIKALDHYDRVKKIENKTVFGPEVTADVSRMKVKEYEEAHPEFIEYRDAVYRYRDNLMQYRLDCGLVSPRTVKMLKEIYPHYVPTARTFAEDAPSKKRKRDRVKNREQVSKTVGRAEGGTSEIIELYRQFADQTISVMREGRKNLFGQRLLDLAQKKKVSQVTDFRKWEDLGIDMETFETRIEEVDPFAKLENKNVFGVFLGGEFWEMDVTDDLYEAVQALEDHKIEEVFYHKLGKAHVNLFKRLCTSMNPKFMITNPIRDFADAVFTSKDTRAWMASLPRAIKEMKNGGEYWQQYRAMGGGFSTVFDMETMRDEEPNTKVGKIVNKVKSNTVGRIEILNQAIEQLPRFAEFIATVKKGDGSMDNMMEAMYNAADITTNFGRSGTWGKNINRYIIPFFNPAVQGTSKAVRMVTERKDFRGFVQLGLKAVFFGVAPAVINSLLYSDDEEWENIRRSDKDRYFLFKIKEGLWIRIPKGRMVSVLGAAGDRIRGAIEGEEAEWASFIGTAADQVAPSNPLTSNIFGPVILASINRTWYGTDIVNQRLEQLPSDEQYDAKTDEISKWIGSVTGLSPKKINYVLDSYTGVVGDLLLPALTPAAERTFIEQSFTLDSNYSNRLSEDFYTKKKDLSDSKNSKDGTPFDDAMYRRWNRNADAISEINAEIRKIEEDNILSGKEKKELLRVQYVARNALMMSFEDYYEAYSKAAEEAAQNVSSMTEEDAAEYIYREANRAVLGTEEALKAYNKATYERAVKLKDEKGIDFDTFYDVYFAEGEPDSEKCFTLITEGLETDSALEISRRIGALEPEEGKTSVSALQKYKAINDSDVTEGEKMQAMAVLASDTDRRRLEVFADYNITLQQFIDVKDNVAYLDDQNEGGVTNAMVKAAVDNVEGLNGSQRAALWQLFTGASSAKNNPYFVEIGSKALAKNKALKEAEE